MGCVFCCCLSRAREAALEGSDEVSAMPRNTKPHGQSPSKFKDEAISVFKCLPDFPLNYITDFHIIKIRKKKHIYLLKDASQFLFGIHI